MRRFCFMLLLLTILAGCTKEGFEPRRETVNGYTVVWVKGSPYDMGYQQGQLLQPELEQGLKEIESNFLLKAMFLVAQDMGLNDLALKSSYPEILEECRGLGDGFGNPAWTMDHCMLLNFGDVLVELVKNGMPEAEDLSPGCTQIAASGKATADGRLYHARDLDWSKIDFVINNPTIFVRQPTGGVGHVVIGFPANLSPYQGMNAAGLAIASNEVDPRDNTVNDRTGRSHVQLVSRMLTEARSLADARAMAQKTNHMSLELVLVSDGNTGQAEVLEMAPTHVGILGLTDGLVYATNHFQETTCATLDKEPPSDSSLSRLARLGQLLPPGGADSLHGKLSPETLVKVLRDRKNGITGVESPAGTFDDGESIATSGALYQIVFDPQGLRFWLSAGKLPVPEQTFTGFSVSELLGMEGAEDHPPPIP